MQRGKCNPVDTEFSVDLNILLLHVTIFQKHYMAYVALTTVFVKCPMPPSSQCD
jgi:hypothetical protein